MPRCQAPYDKKNPLTNEALDRWDDEGGATAKPLPEALIAQVSKVTPLERRVLQCLDAAVLIW